MTEVSNPSKLAPPAARLLAAEAEAAAARVRLSATLADLQVRLSPRALVRDAADAGQQAARMGVHVAKRNPGALAGYTALAGLFLARRQLFALIRGRATGRRQRSSTLNPVSR